MSYQEVNDLKNFISQLVLGSAQTYINQLRAEILSTVHTEVIGLADRVENRVTQFEEGLQQELPVLYGEIDDIKTSLFQIQSTLDDITEGLMKVGKRV
jgi:hypothetical protein